MHMLFLFLSIVITTTHSVHALLHLQNGTANQQVFLNVLGNLFPSTKPSKVSCYSKKDLLTLILQYCSDITDSTHLLAWPKHLEPEKQLDESTSKIIEQTKTQLWPDHFLWNLLTQIHKGNIWLTIFGKYPNKMRVIVYRTTDKRVYSYELQPSLQGHDFIQHVDFSEQENCVVLGVGMGGGSTNDLICDCFVYELSYHASGTLQRPKGIFSAQDIAAAIRGSQKKFLCWSKDFSCIFCGSWIEQRPNVWIITPTENEQLKAIQLDNDISVLNECNWLTYQCSPVNREKFLIVANKKTAEHGAGTTFFLLSFDSRKHAHRIAVLLKMHWKDCDVSCNRVWVEKDNTIMFDIDGIRSKKGKIKTVLYKLYHDVPLILKTTQPKLKKITPKASTKAGMFSKLCRCCLPSKNT